jgi:hypothetical protein
MHSSIPIKKKTKNNRWTFNQTPPLDAKKTKNLLSSLIERPVNRPKPIKSKDGSQEPVDKYFRMGSDFTKDSLQLHKTRNMLLVRKL